jgi:pyruvate dehydrogenase E2 component (dihydrolipoamide acetyltransferase)
MYDFILPDVGEGISEALLISWTVAVGDALEEGAEVATISTDKVDVELPSPRAGAVAELCWQPGDTIPVGQVLMRIEDGGGTATIEPQAKPESKAKSEPKPKPKPAPIESVPEAPPVAPVESAIIAAPSTRKLAADRGIDLAGLRGSGRDGMILRCDVEAAAQPAPAAAPAALDDQPEVRREALNGPRAVAYERLSYSVRTMVHSTMTFEVPADALVALLAKLEPEAEKRGVKLSYAALFAVCVAAALADHPRFNATIDEERRELLLHRDVNMSIAVATEAGLLVPVVRGLNRLSLFAAAAAINDVAQRGRDAALEHRDMQQGTFTLSNTGNLERTTLLSARPIINPPQTAILWVSRINDRPRAKDGAFEVGPMVACSLSFDHRFIDGADATRFVNDLAAMFECPEASLAAG